MVEALGFAAYATNVLGNLLLTQLSIWGWPVRIVSIVLWGGYAVLLEDPSMPLFANAITFFVINCLGWRSWHKRKAEVSEK